MRNYDLEFLKRFSMVIGLLALVTLGLILLALYLHRQLVLPEAPGISRRHHHASDPQLCHAASSFVPSFSYSIPGNAHSSQPPLSYN